jgi:hypothetical protein
LTQTPDEKAAAVRSLLPMLTAHLDAHPGYRIVPRAQWVSEPGPATVPTAACDERCVGCVERCSDEPWAQEYRRLRRAYPVIRRLERLLELRIQCVPGDGRRWKAAISGIYLTPWDIMSHGEWPALAEAGVRWLCEQCDGDVPVFEGAVRVVRAHDVQAEIVALRDRGLSVRRIAQRTGIGRESVRRLLVKLGRLERTESAVS